MCHALAFPIAIWFGGGFGGRAAWAEIELVLSAVGLTWPLWVLPLWWCRDGQNSRLILPLAFGGVSFCAGFLLMLSRVGIHIG
jgi:hypothetical protein